MLILPSHIPYPTLPSNPPPHLTFSFSIPPVLCLSSLKSTPHRPLLVFNVYGYPNLNTLTKDLYPSVREHAALSFWIWIISVRMIISRFARQFYNFTFIYSSIVFMCLCIPFVLSIQQLMHI